MVRRPLLHPSALLFLSLTLAACAADSPPPEAPASTQEGASAAESYPNAVAADPDHYSVVFENDALRIVKVEYGPGEPSVMHSHPASCAITLGTPTWTTTEPDGTVTTDTGAHGQVGCDDAYAHAPRNTSEGSAEVYLVEFAEGATPGTDAVPGRDAVTADPAHYSVEFENEVARLVRIRYEPGEEGVEHGHPAGCNIWLQNPGADGDATAVGALQCGDGNVHTPAGAGDEPVELIRVEFKGHTTLGDGV